MNDHAEWDPLTRIGVWHTALVVPVSADNNTMRPLTKDELGMVADIVLRDREATRSELSQPPIKAQVGPAEQAAGLVYVHDFQLEPEHQLQVGQAVDVLDEGFVHAAVVEERVGPRWSLQLVDVDPPRDDLMGLADDTIGMGGRQSDGDQVRLARLALSVWSEVERIREEYAALLSDTRDIAAACRKLHDLVVERGLHEGELGSVCQAVMDLTSSDDSRRYDEDGIRFRPDPRGDDE